MALCSSPVSWAATRSQSLLGHGVLSPLQLSRQSCQCGAVSPSRGYLCYGFPLYSQEYTLPLSCSFHPNNLPATRKHSGSTAFHKFCCQLFHLSLHKILSPLKPHMTVPHITCCADGHFHQVIYGLGPYITDYPEQALLTSIIQNWCPQHILPRNPYCIYIFIKLACLSVCLKPYLHMVTLGS
jgi:hypothetical protein